MYPVDQISCLFFPEGLKLLHSTKAQKYTSLRPYVKISLAVVLGRLEKMASCALVISPNIFADQTTRVGTRPKCKIIRGPYTSESGVGECRASEGGQEMATLVEMGVSALFGHLIV